MLRAAGEYRACKILKHEPSAMDMKHNGSIGRSRSGGEYEIANDRSGLERCVYMDDVRFFALEGAVECEGLFYLGKKPTEIELSSVLPARGKMDECCLAARYNSADQCRDPAYIFIFVEAGGGDQDSHF